MPKRGANAFIVGGDQARGHTGIAGIQQPRRRIRHDPGLLSRLKQRYPVMNFGVGLGQLVAQSGIDGEIAA